MKPAVTNYSYEVLNIVSSYSKFQNLNNAFKLFMEKFADTTRWQPSDAHNIFKLNYLIEDGPQTAKVLKVDFWNEIQCCLTSRAQLRSKMQICKKLGAPNMTKLFYIVMYKSFNPL